MKYLHYNHVVAADAFSDSPDYLHGIIKFGNESSVGAAPRGRPLSISNKPDNCLAGNVDKGGWRVENAKEDERQPQGIHGQPQGVAPTGEKHMGLSAKKTMQS